jgi:hypothetical protein
MLGCGSNRLATYHSVSFFEQSHGRAQNQQPRSPRTTRYGAPPNGTGKCRTGLHRDCRNLCSLQFDCLRDLAADLVITSWQRAVKQNERLRYVAM